MNFRCPITFPVWLLASLGLAASLPLRADESLRWAVDLSTQQTINLDNDDRLGLYVAGLDLYKIFSTRERDIGTLILQPYFVWLPDNEQRPPFFDGNESTLTWRIANFNFIALPRGRMNIRVGHFEIPFGLEHDINTNGTLRQYSNGVNLGLKADWGIGLNGRLPSLQYEFGLTRGSGQEYFDDGDLYAMSGRVGSLTNRNLMVGISFFDGRIADTTVPIRRKRIGTDLRWLKGPIEVMLEASIGTDDDEDARSWMAEANWSNAPESALIYAQHQRLDITTPSDRPDSSRTGLGIRWLLNRHITISLQFDRTAIRQVSRVETDQIRLLFRYRT